MGVYLEDPSVVGKGIQIWLMWPVAANTLSVLCRGIKFKFQSPDLAAQANFLMMLTCSIYCIHSFAVLDSDERWVFNILMHMSSFLMTSAFAISKES